MVQVSNGAFSSFSRNMEKRIEASKRENIALIIEAVSAVDAEAVSARSKVIEQNSQFAVSVQLEQDQELKLLCDLRCSKSGSPMGKITLGEVSDLLAIVGRDRLVHMLKHRAITTISAKWIFTDDMALEQLTEYDARGYFVYAASRILRCYYEGFNKKVNQFQKDDTAAHYKFIRAKAALWDHLENTPLQTIVEGNELMRRYLSILDTSYATNLVKFTEKCLSRINPATFLKEVRESIGALIWHEFEHGRLRHNITYADVVELNLTYHGHSNFRRQTPLKRLSDTNLVMHTLRGFMSEVHSSKYAVPAKPWQLRELAKKEKLGNNTEIKTVNPTTFKLTFKKPEQTKPLKIATATLLAQNAQRSIKSGE